MSKYSLLETARKELYCGYLNVSREIKLTVHRFLGTNTTGFRAINDCRVRVGMALLPTLSTVPCVVHTGSYTKIKQIKMRLENREESHAFLGRLNLTGSFTDHVFCTIISKMFHNIPI